MERQEDSLIKRLLMNFVAMFAAIGIFLMGYWLAQSPFAPIQLYLGRETPDNVAETFAPFWETWNLIHTQYFDLPLDDEALTQGAIDGMLAVLEDPYTRYLPPADQLAAEENMAGEIQGIGVLVEFVDGNITVVSPFEGSPAESAGIEARDILRQADGVDLTGMDLSEAAELVRGPAGTTVLLTIERDGEQFEVEVERDIIRIPSVRGEILDDGLAYVRLSRFGDNTAPELEEILTELLAENPNGLILDLRGNPGGALDTVIDVADLFLGEGVVMVERFGSGRERVFESTEEGIAIDIPIVVLIDEGSASASEVLAGALRDRGRAVLIGQTTFGKGTVQTWHQLSNTGGIRITTARWLTPEGTWVNEVGLTPDIEVLLPELEEGDEFEDLQLQEAIDYLR